jgi:hypothetical protein
MEKNTRRKITMPSLYELTGDYRQVWDMVNDESVDLAVIEDTLQGIEGAIEDKAVNIVNFIRSLEGDASIIKAEEKRLAERRKAIENRVAHIRDYIQGQMEFASIDKIKTPTVTISLQKNPPAVQIEDETKIPAAFITIVPEQHIPDKKRIAEAMKNGEAVSGATLTQGKSLRIR